MVTDVLVVQCGLTGIIAFRGVQMLVQGWAGPAHVLQDRPTFLIVKTVDDVLVDEIGVTIGNGIAWFKPSELVPVKRG